MLYPKIQKKRKHEDEDDAEDGDEKKQKQESESESDEDPNETIKKSSKAFEVIDQRLSNIILIEKMLMDKWRQQ